MDRSRHHPCAIHFIYCCGALILREMNFSKKAKAIIKKKGIEMPKCWCGSIKPDKYRTKDGDILFYCKNHV